MGYKQYPPFESLPGEVWQPFPNASFYEVSNMGRVRSWKTHNRNNASSQRRSNEPRLRKLIYWGDVMSILVWTDEEEWKLFRLPALLLHVFRGPPPAEGDFIVGFLNGDNHDLRIENMWWKSRGRAEGTEALTELQVNAARESKLSNTLLSALFGADYNSVSRVKRRTIPRRKKTEDT